MDFPKSQYSPPNVLDHCSSPLASILPATVAIPATFILATAPVRVEVPVTFSVPVVVIPVVRILSGLKVSE